MADPAVAAQSKVLDDLEARFAKFQQQEDDARKAAEGRVKECMRKVAGFEQTTGKLQELAAGGGSASDDLNYFVRNVKWTIDDIDKKIDSAKKGASFWSPTFKSMGVDSMQLEFFPNGRESTTIDGFCSLFLWCPSGTKIKYQLFVGKHMRPPDEDEYDGKMGHGHSNFCMLQPEIVTADGGMKSVTVGVEIIEVNRGQIKISGSDSLLTMTARPPHALIHEEMSVIHNAAKTRIEWHISKISQRLIHFPKNSSMHSRNFSAGGIRDLLLEFYPSGSVNTQKEGHCAFYIRGPEGTSLNVTLFVGKFKKGPIKTTFEAPTGKGLPDFCPIADEIDKENDKIIVGIEVENKPNTVMKLK